MSFHVLRVTLKTVYNLVRDKVDYFDWLDITNNRIVEPDIKIEKLNWRKKNTTEEMIRESKEIRISTKEMKNQTDKWGTQFKNGGM